MKKILVAEDDAFLIKVYGAKLSKEGFEVKIAKDGSEVAMLLQDFTPDIMLIDLIMPKKDGFSVLEELKAQEKYKNIPILVTSNLGQPEDKQKALNLGAIEYLVKSDTPLAMIIEKIQEYTK
ncbi:MAG: response regulator [bacterium]|nr:response regulator [bacterium]